MLLLPLVILSKLIHQGAASCLPQLLKKPENFKRNGHEHFEYLALPKCYEKMMEEEPFNKPFVNMLADILVSETANQPTSSSQTRSLVTDVEDILRSVPADEKAKEALKDLEELQENLQLYHDEFELKEKKIKKSQKTIVEAVEKFLIYHLLQKGNHMKTDEEVEDISNKLGGQKKFPVGRIKWLRTLITNGTKEWQYSSYTLKSLVTDFIFSSKQQHAQREKWEIFLKDLRITKFLEGFQEYCQSLNTWLTKSKIIRNEDSKTQTTPEMFKKWCGPFLPPDHRSVSLKSFDEEQFLKNLLEFMKMYDFKDLMTKNLAAIKEQFEGKLKTWKIGTLVGFTEKNGSNLITEKKKLYMSMGSIRNAILSKIVEIIEKKKEKPEKKEIFKSIFKELHECALQDDTEEWTLTIGGKNRIHFESFENALKKSKSNVYFLKSFTRTKLKNRKQCDSDQTFSDKKLMKKIHGIDFTGSITEDYTSISENAYLEVGEYIRNMKVLLCGSENIDDCQDSEENNEEQVSFKHFVENSKNKKKIFFRVHMFEGIKDERREKHPFYRALHELLFGKKGQKEGLMNMDKMDWFKKLTFVIGHSNTIRAEDPFVKALLSKKDRVKAIEVNWNLASNQFIQESNADSTCRELDKIQKVCGDTCQVNLGSDGIGIIGSAKASLDAQLAKLKKKNMMHKRSITK